MSDEVKEILEHDGDLADTASVKTFERCASIIEGLVRLRGSDDINLDGWWLSLRNAADFIFEQQKYIEALGPFSDGEVSAALECFRLRQRIEELEGKLTPCRADAEARTSMRVDIPDKVPHYNADGSLKHHCGETCPDVTDVPDEWQASRPVTDAVTKHFPTIRCGRPSTVWVDCRCGWKLKQKGANQHDATAWAIRRWCEHVIPGWEDGYAAPKPDLESPVTDAEVDAARSREA